MDSDSGTTLISIDPPDADVRASGEFDISTTPILTSQLSDAFGAGCRRFRVDLAEVTFCDASTVGVLVAHRRRLRDAGGTFENVAASECVRRILSLVGLTSMLSDGESSNTLALA